MRHQMANRKLGRTSAHRNAMFRNQVSSVIAHERIVTTLIKAKELRPIVEKFITLGKNDSVHNRRQAASFIADNSLVQKLFTDISPRFAQRPGGYTRIIKLGPRRGDGAEMAILELVDRKEETAAPAPAPAKATKKPAAPKKEAKEPEAEAAPKKKATKKAAAPAGEEKPKRTRKKKEDAE